MKINYFVILCFFWAFIGILTRIIIFILGKRWNKWEENKVYSKKKPIWLYLVGVFAVSIVIYTWYMVATNNVRFSWIIALLLTFILIKVFVQVFNYSKFREYVKKVMNDEKIFRKINVGVFIYSLILVFLGVFYLFM